MAPVDAAVFTVLAWGAVALVLAIFAYELSVVLRELLAGRDDGEQPGP